MSRLNRINFRLVIRNITVFFMIAKTQQLEGISSKIEHNRHIILWDLDGCNLNEAKVALREIQIKYDLSDIAIFSDREDGFCAICYKQVTYMELLKILINTDYIDAGFVSYTAKRNKATLRTKRKEDRGKLEIKAILKSYHIEAPEKLERIIYDTGVVKEGVTIGTVD